MILLRFNFPSLKFQQMVAIATEAEREGFKPPVPVTVHLISNQAHSITLTPLRIAVLAI